jgi:hypothetical protein
VIIPLAAFGPTRTVGCYRALGVRLLGPALGVGDDKQLAKELTAVTGTDSQSFLAAIHNTTHLNRATRPADASPRLRRTHWLLGGLMTLLTFAAIRRRAGAAEGVPTVLLIGALMINMILVSPVCHLHYFVLSLPLLMGLMAAEGAHTVYPSWRLRSLMALNLIGTVLPSVPRMEVLRDLCLAMYAAVLVWAYACLVGLRRSTAPAPANSLPLAA